MEFPLGDPLRRVGYDYLHLMVTQPPPEQVMVIAFNESTERKLKLKQNEPLSRNLHARLLRRLREAGAERVCYDVVFDQPSADAQADDEFRNEIQAHGRVILAGSEQVIQTDNEGIQTKFVAPLEMFQAAAEGCGTVHLPPPDPDGVVRRVTLTRGDYPPLAAAVAMAEMAGRKKAFRFPPPGAWFYFMAPPGTVMVREFAECLDPELVPNHLFRGRTVFVGGQYSLLRTGRPDTIPTSFTRFGAPEIPGVEWHAAAFTNFRDSLWLRSATFGQNAALAFVFAFAWTVLTGVLRKAWVIALGSVGLAALVTTACLYVAWNESLVVNWLAIPVVQLPVALIGLAVQLLATRRGARATGRIQIFISAVSAEFQAERDELRRKLDRQNVTVKIQEQFVASGTETLDKLDDYIRACDAVIHIVGDLTGAFPREPAVAALRRRYADLEKRLPPLAELLKSSAPPVSYTQWEAYLAVYHRKMLLIAAPVGVAERPAIAGVDSAQREAQQQHLERLRRMGRYAEIRFENIDKLVIEVLRSNLQDLLIGAQHPH